jgi:hypothetical protein
LTPVIESEPLRNLPITVLAVNPVSFMVALTMLAMLVFGVPALSGPVLSLPQPIAKSTATAMKKFRLGVMLPSRSRLTGASHRRRQAQPLRRTCRVCRAAPPPRTCRAIALSQATRPEKIVETET